MRIVVEIPETHGRTERHARGYVVSALAAVDNTRTRHDARVYWGERVKSFDRVYTAVVERPHSAPCFSAAGRSRRKHEPHPILRAALGLRRRGLFY